MSQQGRFSPYQGPPRPVFDHLYSAKTARTSTLVSTLFCVRSRRRYFRYMID
jgi:hypothetical protein